MHRATQKSPVEPGDYNVSYPGVASIVPLFKSWDGEKWLGCASLDFWWYEYCEPFGSQNPEYAQPKEPTLQERLAEYRKKKGIE